MNYNEYNQYLLDMQLLKLIVDKYSQIRMLVPKESMYITSAPALTPIQYSTVIPQQVEVKRDETKRNLDTYSQTRMPDPKEPMYITSAPMQYSTVVPQHVEVKNEETKKTFDTYSEEKRVYCKDCKTDGHSTYYCLYSSPCKLCIKHPAKNKYKHQAYTHTTMGCKHLCRFCKHDFPEKPHTVHGNTDHRSLYY